MDDDGVCSVDSGRASEMDAEEEPPQEPNFGESQRREKVESDLGAKVIQDLPDAADSGSEFSDGTSGNESISCHEFGLRREDVESDGEEELVPEDGKVIPNNSMVVDPNDEEELVPAEGAAKFFHKNTRKKMHGVLRDVKHMAQTASTCSTGASSPRPTTLIAQQEESAPLRLRRRPGPLRIIEIFTWTMAVSFAAHERGWEVGEPLTLPNYNLLDPGDQRKAFEYAPRLYYGGLSVHCVVWPSDLRLSLPRLPRTSCCST